MLTASKVKDPKLETEGTAEKKNNISTQQTDNVNKFDNIYKKIIKIVGEDRAKRDEYNRIMYSHDLAPLPKMMGLMFKMTPDIVVKPRNAGEISKIMKIAVKNDVPVIPRGAGTWGLGGAVPTNGGILLDMGSLNKILRIDKENLSVTVEPGVKWQGLYDKVLRKGLFVGAYPSSAPGASVGGWVNTGGIGIGSYKYGGVDRQIRSMDVVLPNGKIIKVGFENVMSNSSGYNIGSLFIGSEGTLGVITKVTLQLHPAPEVIKPVSYSFSDLKHASKAIYVLSRTNIVPLHIGFFDNHHLRFLKKIGKDTPDVNSMVNIALEGTKSIVNYEEKVIDAIMKKNNGKKMSKKVSKHEWEERYYELRTKRLGPTVFVGEAFIPTSKLEEMIEKTRALIKKMKIRASIVGFVPDRNTVTLMPYVLSDERQLIKSMATMAFIKKLADIAFDVGGRPAGLGTFFAVNMQRMHGKAVETMGDIKTTFDPYNIMNPGKFIEGVTRYGIPIPAFGFNIGMDTMAIMRGLMGKDKSPKSK
ncbi:MAG: FAD-binding oxidoreductase [Thermoplasmata archaeon]|nr:FAD-binding oxidoreductase [Thermoplasmata archaeon]